jgi:hypothetical protein
MASHASKPSLQQKGHGQPDSIRLETRLTKRTSIPSFRSQKHLLLLCIFSLGCIHTKAFVLSSSNLESCVVTGSPPGGNASLQSVDLTTLSYLPKTPVQISFMRPGDLDVVTSSPVSEIAGPDVLDIAFTPPIAYGAAAPYPAVAPAPSLTSSSGTCLFGVNITDPECGAAPAENFANSPSDGNAAASSNMAAGTTSVSPDSSSANASDGSGVSGDAESTQASMTVSAKLADASGTDITCKNKILVTFIVQNGQVGQVYTAHFRIQLEKHTSLEAFVLLV